MTSSTAAGRPERPRSSGTWSARTTRRLPAWSSAGSISGWPVGAPSTSEDLWSRLARELLDAGVLKRRFPVIRPERVAEAVKIWLDQSLNRRIRLLVDEADQFLEQDAEEHYPQTGHCSGT